MGYAVVIWLSLFSIIAAVLLGMLWSHRKSMHLINTQSSLEMRKKNLDKLMDKLLVIYILAEDGRKFGGYELFQTFGVLGLRFGEMNIFHRHREETGSGPILFSLARATEPGTFDLQKIGNTFCEGLTLFMHFSQNPTIDRERFELLLQTAQQLAEDLGGVLCNAAREHLTPDMIEAYEKEIS